MNELAYMLKNKSSTTLNTILHYLEGSFIIFLLWGDHLMDHISVCIYIFSLYDNSPILSFFHITLQEVLPLT